MSVCVCVCLCAARQRQAGSATKGVPRGPGEGFPARIGETWLAGWLARTQLCTASLSHSPTHAPVLRLVLLANAQDDDSLRCVVGRAPGVVLVAGSGNPGPRRRIPFASMRIPLPSSSASASAVPNPALLAPRIRRPSSPLPVHQLCRTTNSAHRNPNTETRTPTHPHHLCPLPPPSPSVASPPLSTRVNIPHPRSLPRTYNHCS